MLFPFQLMGIEIPVEYHGSGSNFMSTIVAIEEIAKVDMGISLMVCFIPQYCFLYIYNFIVFGSLSTVCKKAKAAFPKFFVLDN